MFCLLRVSTNLEFQVFLSLTYLTEFSFYLRSAKAGLLVKRRFFVIVNENIARRFTGPRCVSTSAAARSPADYTQQLNNNPQGGVND